MTVAGGAPHPRPAPRLAVLAEEADGVGGTLANERRMRALSLEQVATATRIRPVFLRALERDDLAALPGPVYTRGYVRTYAEYLGLEAAPLLARLPAPAPAAVSRRRLRLPAGVALTGPVVGAAGLILAVALFATYAAYEFRSARLDAAPSPAPTAAGPPPIASPAPLPSIDPTAAATTESAAVHPIAVAIKATELVWVQVTIDGKAAYGTSGRMLQPGAEDVFVGQKIKIQAGKPSLLVSVSGGDYAPLGVLSKEYTAQT